jgi:PIN domain nuclease of toxin-antitoxin system
MNKAVLDSSALLAFINQEDGCEVVEKYLANAPIVTADKIWQKLNLNNTMIFSNYSAI